VALLGDYFSREGRERRAVLRVLRSLHRSKAPFRMEIERASLHFYSMLSLRTRVLIVAKPMAISNEIRRGGRVRLRVPDEPDQEVGMEVISADHRLLSGNRVFLCDIPTHFIKSPPRTEDRFSTVRFRELSLFVRNVRRSFRIINLSTGGCRIFSDGEPQDLLKELGREMGPARIAFGRKLAIELDAVVPRYYNHTTVGLQMHLTDSGRSHRFLSAFMRKLETVEMQRLRVESLG